MCAPYVWQRKLYTGQRQCSHHMSKMSFIVWNQLSHVPPSKCSLSLKSGIFLFVRTARLTLGFTKPAVLTASPPYLCCSSPWSYCIFQLICGVYIWGSSPTKVLPLLSYSFSKAGVCHWLDFLQSLGQELEVDLHHCQETSPKHLWETNKPASNTKKSSWKFPFFLFVWCLGKRTMLNPDFLI